MISKILNELNVAKKCRDYRLAFWQCPHFIFLVLGLVIIVALVLAYFVGQKYIEDPIMVTILVLMLAAALIVLNYFITHSFEKLAEVSKMRADFIHIASHQLRAPLSNFKWGLEALFKAFQKKRTQEEVEYIGILRDNTQRMLDLVSELLTVVRLEESRLPLDIKSVDLGQFVLKALDRFSAFAKAKNITIKFEAKSDLPFVLGDALLLQQVVENLLDNAIKYGGKEIKISLGSEGPYKRVRFEIADSGPGILPQERKYLFEKFFRGEYAKKAVPEGTGLGLFVAKEIIERHQGLIGFWPKKGGGSIFWFTLPAAKTK